jgi:hypothetical protein
MADAPQISSIDCDAEARRCIARSENTNTPVYEFAAIAWTLLGIVKVVIKEAATKSASGGRRG